MKKWEQWVAANQAFSEALTLFAAREQDQACWISLEYTGEGPRVHGRVYEGHRVHGAELVIAWAQLRSRYTSQRDLLLDTIRVVACGIRQRIDQEQ